MTSNSFTYYLPPKLIAQTPADPRDSSRLMLIDKTSGNLSHQIFRELPSLLKSTDVLVFNNTAVFPARLHGHKSTGGKVEILLLKNIEKDLWEVISHPGIKPGQTLIFSSNLTAHVIDSNRIKFSILHSELSSSQLISQLGTTPLPPYIHSNTPESILRQQYQTVYSQPVGSAAAPTAGLHFTPELLTRLQNLDFKMEYLTLHVGLGTFKSPSPEQISSGKLHSEWFTLSKDTAAKLNQYKRSGSRIIAVGTTSTRVLETCADTNGHLSPQTGDTDIFILPPYKFKFVDGMITNFHLPGSSLLMLVSAFASPEIISSAYKEAVKKSYRFFSFGDACLII